MRRIHARKRLWIVLAVIAAITPLAVEAQAPPLSETAGQFVQIWKAEFAKLRNEQAARGAPESIAVDISRRAELDRAARTGVNPLFTSDVPAIERGWVIRDVFVEIGRMDAENTAVVKAALPDKGWFAPTKDAPDLPTDAWLLVQHSPDKALQAEALVRIEPLVKTGAVAGGDYAKLFDRVRQASGQKQRYASQGKCLSGVWQLDPIETPNEVDRLRGEIGWTETVEETRARLKIGAPC